MSEMVVYKRKAWEVLASVDLYALNLVNQIQPCYQKAKYEMNNFPWIGGSCASLLLKCHLVLLPAVAVVAVAAVAAAADADAVVAAVAVVGAETAANFDGGFQNCYFHLAANVA